MAAVISRQEVGARDIGTQVAIPDDPKARIMFYIKCICDVLDLESNDNLQRLTDYNKYYLLTENEIDQLTLLCIAVEPDKLEGKCIFEDTDGTVCTTSGNKFIELESVRNQLLITGYLLIGGQQRQVRKVMFYRKEWLVLFYLIPIVVLAARLEYRVEEAKRQKELEQQRQLQVNVYSHK